MQKSLISNVRFVQGIGARERRDNLRRSWVPVKDKMRQIEKQGIYIRFVVGYR